MDSIFFFLWGGSRFLFLAATQKLIHFAWAIVAGGVILPIYFYGTGISADH